MIENKDEQMEKQNRYINGKIYNLIHPESGNFYIGSTCDKLCKRLYRHRDTAKREKARKVYMVFNELGWENIIIRLLQECPCESKEQLLRAEYNVIQKYINDPLCLNSYTNYYGVGVKEYKKMWVKENAEHVREVHHAYMEKMSKV